MPRLVTVERDYPAVAEKMAALGPLTDTLGSSVKGVAWVPAGAVDYLRRANGTVRGGVADGRPALARDVHLAEAILALSGTTNGRVALQAWQEREKRTGVQLADLADAPSPYAHVIEAVCAQLPALRRPDQALVRQFWDSGPPAEEVGLEPFAPPGYLTGTEISR